MNKTIFTLANLAVLSGVYCGIKEARTAYSHIKKEKYFSSIKPAIDSFSLFALSFLLYNLAYNEEETQEFIGKKIFEGVDLTTPYVKECAKRVEPYADRFFIYMSEHFCDWRSQACKIDENDIAAKIRRALNTSYFDQFCNSSQDFCFSLNKTVKNSQNEG